jgi:hypothetical protein
MPVVLAQQTARHTLTLVAAAVQVPLEATLLLLLATLKVAELAALVLLRLSQAHRQLMLVGVGVEPLEQTVAPAVQVAQVQVAETTTQRHLPHQIPGLAVAAVETGLKVVMAAQAS